METNETLTFNYYAYLCALPGIYNYTSKPKNLDEMWENIKKSELLLEQIKTRYPSIILQEQSPYEVFAGSIIPIGAFYTLSLMLSKTFWCTVAIGYASLKAVETFNIARVNNKMYDIKKEEIKRICDIMEIDKITEITDELLSIMHNNMLNDSCEDMFVDSNICIDLYSIFGIDNYYSLLNNNIKKAITISYVLLYDYLPEYSQTLIDIRNYTNRYIEKNMSDDDYITFLDNIIEEYGINIEEKNKNKTKERK